MTRVGPYAWLPLREVERWEELAERQGVSKVARGEVRSKMTKEGFVQAYSACRGEPRCMARRMATKGQTWAHRRVGFIKRHLAQAKKNHEPWWEPNGMPTKRHLGLIMWAYSPQPAELRRRQANPPPVPREGDRLERELERQAAQGDVEAEAKLIRKRVRATTLFEEQVRLLADLGDPAAIMAVGMTSTDLPLFAQERLHVGGPMYGAFVLLAAVESAENDVLEIGRLPLGLWNWIADVRSLLRNWIAGSRNEYMLGEWAALWDQTEYAAGMGHDGPTEAAHSCAEMALRGIMDIQERPQGGNLPGGFNVRLHWPAKAFYAVHHASRVRAFRLGIEWGNAPGDPGTIISDDRLNPETLDGVKARLLHRLKPWVWAKGPMVWVIPDLLAEEEAQEWLEGRPHRWRGLRLNPGPPDRWEAWQHSIPEDEWIAIHELAQRDRRAALVHLRRLYFAWIERGRGMRPALFGEEGYEPPSDPLPPWEQRPWRFRGPHDWEPGS